MARNTIYKIYDLRKDLELQKDIIEAQEPCTYFEPSRRKKSMLKEGKEYQLDIEVTKRNQTIDDLLNSIKNSSNVQELISELDKFDNINDIIVLFDRINDKNSIKKATSTLEDSYEIISIIKNEKNDDKIIEKIKYYNSITGKKIKDKDIEKQIHDICGFIDESRQINKSVKNSTLSNIIRMTNYSDSIIEDDENSKDKKDVKEAIKKIKSYKNTSCFLSTINRLYKIEELQTHINASTDLSNIVNNFNKLIMKDEILKNLKKSGKIEEIISIIKNNDNTDDIISKMQEENEINKIIKFVNKFNKIYEKDNLKYYFMKEKEALEFIKSLENKNKAKEISEIKYEVSPIKELVIPDSVTHILPYAFSPKYIEFVRDTNGTKEYNLDEHGNRIIKSVKEKNIHLEKVILGKNVAIIGEGAFKDCVNLKEVDFSQCDILGVIGDEAFANCKIKSFVAPIKLTSIRRKAFENCDLEYIDLYTNPSLSNGFGLTFIGKDAFCGNPKIKSVDLPSSVQNGYYEEAFEDDVVINRQKNNRSFNTNHAHNNYRLKFY